MLHNTASFDIQKYNQKNGAQGRPLNKIHELPILPRSPEGWTAVFTGFLAVTTVGLWVVTRVAAYAARDAAVIANRALTDLERPYVFVHGTAQLEINPDQAGGYTGVIVRYIISNYGKMPAAIEEITAGFSLTPAIDPLDEGRNRMLRHRTWAPAHEETTWHPLPLAFSYRGDTDNITLTDQDPDGLFFRVIIRYRGPLSGGHETSACWVLSELTNRFITGPPEHNYERDNA